MQTTYSLARTNQSIQVICKKAFVMESGQPYYWVTDYILNPWFGALKRTKFWEKNVFSKPSLCYFISNRKIGLF